MKSKIRISIVLVLLLSMLLLICCKKEKYGRCELCGKEGKIYKIWVSLYDPRPYSNFQTLHHLFYVKIV